MIRQTYIEFIESFGELNPYELSHFCRELYCQCYNATRTENMGVFSLTQNDLQQAIIQSLHTIQIEFAEKKLLEAEINLKRIKAITYKEQL